MKKLLFLLLFIPFMSIGQITYDDLMSINSLETFKKVVIENDFEYGDTDGDWVRYGYGVERDSTNTITTSEIYGAYNIKDNRWSFQMPMTYESWFGKADTDASDVYQSITKEIKANCKYDKIVNYKKDDFVSYNCSDSLYGFVISEGLGIIRYFPPNAPTQD